MNLFLAPQFVALCHDSPSRRLHLTCHLQGCFQPQTLIFQLLLFASSSPAASLSPPSRPPFTMPDSSFENINLIRSFFYAFPVRQKPKILAKHSKFSLLWFLLVHCLIILLRCFSYIELVADTHTYFLSHFCVYGLSPWSSSGSSDTSCKEKPSSICSQQEFLEFLISLNSYSSLPLPL